MALDDQARIGAARAYVDALVSHDPSTLRIDAACRRTELGVVTGRNGPHIVASLRRGPQFRLIHRISDFEARVNGRVVETTYRVHVRPKFIGLSAQVTESFEVDDDGRIAAIVASFSLPQRR